MIIYKQIEKAISRDLSEIVYDIWGKVGFATGYDMETKEIILIIYDRSCKSQDKKKIINKRFKYDLENMNNESIAKIEIIEILKEYLLKKL